MSQVMLVSMVTGCAKVIIGALSTFPANANDGLLTAGVTHGSIVFNAWEERGSKFSNHIIISYFTYYILSSKWLF